MLTEKEAYNIGVKACTEMLGAEYLQNRRKLTAFSHVEKQVTIGVSMTVSRYTKDERPIPGTPFSKYWAKCAYVTVSLSDGSILSQTIEEIQ
jgi:hypothetical protein